MSQLILILFFILLIEKRPLILGQHISRTKKSIGLLVRVRPCEWDFDLIFAYSEEALVIGNSGLVNGGGPSALDAKAETPHVKKRHRRIKSSGLRNNDCDG